MKESAKPKKAGWLAPLAVLPSDESLKTRLAAILTAGNEKRLTIRKRVRNVYNSTFPGEIVHCRVDYGREQQLFCKYLFQDIAEADGRSVSPFYEIDVYSRILDKAPLRLPRYFGSWREADGSEGCLVIEYLHDSNLLNHAVEHEDAMEAAARWIGRFQKYAGAWAFHPDLAFLRRFDAAHYHDRCARMLDAIGAERVAHPWIETLVNRFDKVLEFFDGDVPTVVHAEYYPKNILMCGSEVIPIDWETASLGAGAMDLATLTENWSEEVSSRCYKAYAEERGISLDDLYPQLHAATVLMHVHWLGISPDPERPKWSESTAGSWRFERLKNAATKIGLA